MRGHNYTLHNFDKHYVNHYNQSLSPIKVNYVAPLHLDTTFSPHHLQIHRSRHERLAAQNEHHHATQRVEYP
jgi:hypothetical protein